jgi:hypothetical protein
MFYQGTLARGMLSTVDLLIKIAILLKQKLIVSIQKGVRINKLVPGGKLY